MRYSQRPRLLHLILALCLSTVLYTPSLAEDMALLSIGPRIGFGEKVPLMGKEQKYYFHLTDVAAVIKLPGPGRSVEARGVWRRDRSQARGC